MTGYHYPSELPLRNQGLTATYMLFCLPIQDLTLPRLCFGRFDPLDDGRDRHLHFFYGGRGDNAEDIGCDGDKFRVDSDV